MIERHFHDLQKKYGAVVAIDLVNSVSIALSDSLHYVVSRQTTTIFWLEPQHKVCDLKIRFQILHLGIMSYSYSAHNYCIFGFADFTPSNGSKLHSVHLMPHKKSSYVVLEVAKSFFTDFIFKLIFLQVMLSHAYLLD